MAPWATKQGATGSLDSFSSDQCMQTIAITQGDSAGIGPEIVAKAFRDAAAELRGCFVVGDVASLRRAAQALVRPGMPGVPVAQISAPAQALKMPPRCVPGLQVPRIPGPPPRGPGRGGVWALRGIRKCCRPKPPRTRAWRWNECRCA